MASGFCAAFGIPPVAATRERILPLWFGSWRRIMKILASEYELNEASVNSRENVIQHRNAERVATWGALALVLYAALRGLFGAASKAFWFDEICTWIVARQPTVAGIWDALKNASDAHPPLFYLIERAASHLTVDPQIALRIPSILGFCCVLWCLFIFIRTRTTGYVALLSVATVMSTALFGFMAEARPYSMVVACISFALVCYQRAPALGWVIGLAASLVVAQSLHYYALLALVPFGVAEGILWFKARHFRPVVWAALGCGLLPLFAFWPLLSQIRAVYGKHFW